MERVVIAGGGMAALESVFALRDGGFEGEIVVLSAEQHRPYDLPPLSKDVLSGDRDETEFEADWDDLAVDLRMGSRVTGLSEGVVQTDIGCVGYDGLILATGTSPVRLPFADDASRSLCYLRTIEDALALRSRLVPNAHVVIVGAGWIGAEVATVAAARGCITTVVEARTSPLPSALPASIGQLTAAWYAEAGVQLVLGSAVRSIQSNRVELEDGRTLRADTVVIGVGVRPETAWLKRSAVELDELGYVIVDESMRTSAPGVVAVGDCASWFSRRYGRRLRTGHWDHALRSPSVAVVTLLGGSEVYDPVPYFWSDQLGRHVQYVGCWSENDDLVLRGDPDQLAWSAVWTSGDRLTALLAVDRPRDIADARKIIEVGQHIDPAMASDPAISLKDAIAVDVAG